MSYLPTGTYVGISVQILKFKVMNFGFGSGSSFGSFIKLELVKKINLSLYKDTKKIETLIFLNYSSIVYQIVKNLLTF